MAWLIRDDSGHPVLSQDWGDFFLNDIDAMAGLFSGKRSR